jgi:hypothetical protein
MATYRADWNDEIHRRLDSERSIPLVHSWYVGGKYTVEGDIRLTKDPGSTASHPLSYAIDIGCVFPDHPFVRDFADWTVRFSELALADAEKWQTVWSGGWNRPRLLKVYAEIDYTLIGQSRDLAIDFGMTLTGELWGGPFEADYLSAVQACLAIGDVNGARLMMRKRRTYLTSKTWHAMLSKFAEAARTLPVGTVVTGEEADRFRHIFDLIRAPKASTASAGFYIGKVSMLRLELALINRRYILGKPLAGAWREVLLSISE